MKAATAFTLALFVPHGTAFVQPTSAGNTWRHRNADEHHRSRVASKQHPAEAADVMPDSQTLSEVSTMPVSSLPLNPSL